MRFDQFPGSMNLHTYVKCMYVHLYILDCRSVCTYNTRSPHIFYFAWTNCNTCRCMCVVFLSELSPSVWLMMVILILESNVQNPIYFRSIWTVNGCIHKRQCPPTIPKLYHRNTTDHPRVFVLFHEFQRMLFLNRLEFNHCSYLRIGSQRIVIVSKRFCVVLGGSCIISGST